MRTPNRKSRGLLIQYCAWDSTLQVLGPRVLRCNNGEINPRIGPLFSDLAEQFGYPRALCRPRPALRLGLGEPPGTVAARGDVARIRALMTTAQIFANARVRGAAQTARPACLGSRSIFGAPIRWSPHDSNEPSLGASGGRVPKHRRHSWAIGRPLCRKSPDEPIPRYHADRLRTSLWHE